MTIRELCETNSCICDIEIEVRKRGRLQHRYRFGKGARFYPGDNVQILLEGKNITYRDITDVDKTPINSHDGDKDYYKVTLNNIPKRFQFLLDMDIESWRASHAYRGWSSYYNSAVSLFIEIETEKDVLVLHDQNQDRQLKGQMNIMDILED